MEYTKEMILAKIESSPAWLERGIVAIFEKQLVDEQRSEESRYHNGVGFSHCHARRGSYYAKWIQSGKHLNGVHIVLAKKMMRKYSGQLAKIANGEI